MRADFSKAKAGRLRRFAFLSLMSGLVAAFGHLVPVLAAEPAVQEQLTVCAGCHGDNGVSSMENTPSLAGHPALYTQIQLFLFREGQRVNEAMNAVTQGMSDDRLTALAEHYSKLPPLPPTGAPDPALDARGREIAASHRCGTCHLPDYAGRDQMPRIAGQREDYLLKALRDYKGGARAGDGAQMAEVVYGLGDDDLKAVAHHIAHFK
jgi:cytochrome c553